MQYILFFFAIFVLSGCSPKVEPVPDKTTKTSSSPSDLFTLPQDIKSYTKKFPSLELLNSQKDYKKSYFKIWNNKKPKHTLKDIQWPFNIFNASNSFGENLQPLEKDFFDAMHDKSQFKNYLSVNKKALTLKHVNLRAMPTLKPLLRDPSKAGEGFPFDYLQNSSVNANVPLYISHYSQDKQWVFVFTSFAYGWLQSVDIVNLDEDTVKLYKTSDQVFITQENIPIYTKDHRALFNTRIGMVFPFVKEDATTYTILVRTQENPSSVAYSVVSKAIASKSTLTFNKNNLNKLITNVDSKYGWGGMFEQRDCSSTLMDLFTPFGIWLPRNSFVQSKVGKVIKLSHLNDEEKLRVIKEKAIPFQTLLYKRGHIVLYIGTYDNKVVIFQNVWGIKTIKDNVKGRHIVGKTVFSTLRFGKDLENYNENEELLRNIKSMNIITR